MNTKNRPKAAKPSSYRFFSIVSMLALVAFLITAILIPIALSTVVSASKGTDNDSVFRLHIIANSDSERDQQIKLAIRDAVLEFEKNGTQAAFADNSNDARHIIMANADNLLNAVEAALDENGADYGAQLVLGEFDFPDREYSGTFYPAGEYTALRIVLGEGDGKNWWCVMFPPLCIVNDDSGKIEDEQSIEFDSFFVKIWKQIFGG